MQKKQGLTKLQYRPDIDGLRAIAVILVVIFHAFPKWLPNGFIGVDVFFVISGFLITQILIQEIESGSFSYISFYSRRIRRIFPSLILVLTCCFAAGWHILTWREFQQLGAHIAGGAGFISNWVLYEESGYFDNAAELKPLLHLWSLSLEEQFYILWPLLLWIFWKKQLNIAFFILIIAATSFALNIKALGSNSALDFFSPQTRFWEILLGSLAALIAAYPINWLSRIRSSCLLVLDDLIYANPVENPEFRNATIQSWLGLLSILLGLFAIDKEFFPGWYALLPTIGCALIITAGPSAYINRALLSIKPLVWIGLISYPLYLWHWPILSFLRIIFNESPPRSIRVCALLCSGILAYLTYRFIDKPMRFGSHLKIKTIFLLVAMLSVGSVGYYTYKSGGIESRFTPLISSNNLDQRSWQWNLHPEGTQNCEKELSNFKYTICSTTTNPTVAIIGDSHAAALFYGFTQSNNSKLNQVAVFAGGACQPTLGIQSYPGCNKLLRETLSKIRRSPNIKYVLLTSYYYEDIENAKNPETLSAYVEGYTKTIKALEGMGKKVIFVIDIPAMIGNPELCVPGPNKLRQKYQKIPEFCSALSESDLRPRTEYDQFLERLRDQNSNIIFYDPSSLLCQEGKCKIFNNSELLYSDSHHLSIYGSKLIANDLILQMQKY